MTASSGDKYVKERKKERKREKERESQYNAYSKGCMVIIEEKEW